MNEKPDILITADKKAYQEAMKGKTVAVSWPEMAKEIWPTIEPLLREKYPGHTWTLEDFVKHCPYRMEIVHEANREDQHVN